MNTCLTRGNVGAGVLVDVELVLELWLLDDEGAVTVWAACAGTVTVTEPPPEPPPPPEDEAGAAPESAAVWLVCDWGDRTASRSGAPVALSATEPTDDATTAPNASMPITATAAARGWTVESRSSQSRAGPA